jgi:small-conductance mechanosensitive channel
MLARTYLFFPALVVCSLTPSPEFILQSTTHCSGLSIIVVVIILAAAVAVILTALQLELRLQKSRLTCNCARPQSGAAGTWCGDDNKFGAGWCRPPPTALLAAHSHSHTCSSLTFCSLSACHQRLLNGVLIIVIIVIIVLLLTDLVPTRTPPSRCTNTLFAAILLIVILLLVFVIIIIILLVQVMQQMGGWSALRASSNGGGVRACARRCLLPLHNDPGFSAE